MPKHQHSSAGLLKIRLKDTEVVLTHVCFTGSAIALLNAYAGRVAVIHLDDWHWHEEVRGGSAYYIVTDIKIPAMLAGPVISDKTSV